MVRIFRVDEGKVPGRWGSFAGGVVQVPWGDCSRCPQLLSLALGGSDEFRDFRDR